MIESFVLFLVPAAGTFNFIELSCLCSGGFFFAMYLVVLSLWIITTPSSDSIKDRYGG